MNTISPGTPNTEQEITLPTCDDKSIWEVFLSRFEWPALTLADELGLFPLLWERPRDCAEVAAVLEIKTRATEAILGVLSGLGFVVHRDGKFHLTDVSRNYLLPGSKFYKGAQLQLFRDHTVTHATLKEAILRDATSGAHGTDQWSSRKPDPDKLKNYTSMIHASSLPAALGLAVLGNVSSVERLLDVAGGSGCFSIALALRDQNLHCTVMELAPVCDLVDQYVAEHGLQNRIASLSANMFSDPWPDDCDGIFFSNVFHDWDEEKCLFLARKSYEALPPGGRIFIHEQLLNDTQDGPLSTALFSLSIVWVNPGKQYSTPEISGFLTEAGFSDLQISPAYGLFSLVSAVKP